MFKVKFADIGEGLTEGKVTEVLVKLGDSVKMGDALFFVETDKVNSEIPAPVDGVVAKILVSPDQEIKVGDVVFEIEDGKGDSVQEPVKEEENASVVGSTPVSNDLIPSRGGSNQSNSSTSKNIQATPFTKKEAAKQNIDLSKIVGSGPNGRILFADLLNIASTTNEDIFATPLARKVAELEGIDLSKVIGSGPNGRIFKEDLQNIKKVEVSKTETKTSSVETSKESRFTPPVFSDELTFVSKPMNGIRKATVKAMVKSHTENAAFTGMVNVDITKTYELRAQLKDFAVEQNVKLTYLAFIIKASAFALREMPNINVRIDSENNSIKYMDNINIGVAVDTPDGLMVPVIKGADKMSVMQIANAITDLASKAKNKKLKTSEMKDATFTVSNFGSVGLDYATPIINSPESMILGVGNMRKTPTYIGNDIVPRWMMPFSATADHRIIDGGDAGRFIQKIAHYLNNPVLLLV